MGLAPLRYGGRGHTEHFGLWAAEGEDQTRGIAADCRVLIAETWEALGPFPRGSPTSTQRRRGGQGQTCRALRNSYFIMQEPWETQPLPRSGRAPVPPAPGTDRHRGAGDGTGTSQPLKRRG